METRFYNLKNLLEIKYGKSQKNIEEPCGKYPILGTGGVIGHTNQFLYDKPSVLIGRKGTIDKIQYIEQPFWTIDTLFYTIINEKLIIPKFLYYRLLLVDLTLYNEGTSIPSLTTKTLYKLEIDIPTVNIQKKILKILNNLDKKIEINKKINKNLGKLIDERYIELFEFFNQCSSDNFKESELGKIPQDWNVYTLGDYVKVFNGYSYKSEELKESDNAMITIKNFDIDGNFKIDGFKEIQLSEKLKPQHYVKNFEVLVACTDMTQDARIIGNSILLLDNLDYDNIIMSMDLVKVKSTIPEINSFLLGTILKSKRFKHHALGYINGTTVLHLDKKAISKFKIALPTDFNILLEYGEEFKRYYLEISHNIKEIEKLTKLRDTLLPKLMSGELDVSGVDI